MASKLQFKLYLTNNNFEAGFYVLFYINLQSNYELFKPLSQALFSRCPIQCYFKTIIIHVLEEIELWHYVNNEIFPKP